MAANHHASPPESICSAAEAASSVAEAIGSTGGEARSWVGDAADDAAAWSLFSNAMRHPKVKATCKKLAKEDDTLTATEKRILQEKVLSRLDLAEQQIPE